MASDKRLLCKRELELPDEWKLAGQQEQIHAGGEGDEGVFRRGTVGVLRAGVRTGGEGRGAARGVTIN